MSSTSSEVERQKPKLLGFLILLVMAGGFAVYALFFGGEDGHARAAAMLAPAKAGLPVAEYAALDIKKSVVGAGRADKDQVLFMVQRLLPLADKKMKADAADALACAITHAHKRKMNTLKRETQLAPTARSAPGSRSRSSSEAVAQTKKGAA